jgi:alpha-L-arabinofuranosidase
MSNGFPLTSRAARQPSFSEFTMTTSFCVASRNTLLAVAALVAGLAFSAPASAADPGKIAVDVNNPKGKFNPIFYGLMTEEINYSYEGGLYGELIQNRNFKNSGGGGRGRGAGAAPVAGVIQGLPHWFVVTSDNAQGAAATDATDVVNATALNTSLKLTIANVPAGGRVGVANDGFWGIPAKPNATYQCNFYAKASDGFTGPLTLTIESDDGKTVHATATVAAITDKWQKYSVALKTGQLTPSATNRFVISGASKGTVTFGLVSLFPPTYKERTGTALGGRPATGFRPDIMQLLADMKPAYLRFPGGNYVEGSNFANRWNWKATIGPWEERPGHQSPWGYRSTDGLGLLEYLEWCEELKMEPVVAVYAGLHLDNARDVRTGDALKPFIQDALDEIEYISGPATSEWGAKRAKDGHPEPFKFTYMEIGNEDFLNNGAATYRGPEGRYAMFYSAIKAKYPNIQVIATTNPGVPHDMIDNHAYMPPTTAIRNAHQYDNTSRTGPKIFEGEWASQESGMGRRPLTPTYQCAISDAAFMTGLERNADIVIMHCYAPLFTRIEPNNAGNQWQTNLIGYNSLTSYGSPPYYAQKMFANNRGDQILPIKISDTTPYAAPAPASEPAPATAPGGRGGRGGRGPGAPRSDEPLFASASKEDSTGDIILKVVNIFPQEQAIIVDLAGATVLPNATGLRMTGEPMDTNSIEDPLHTVPKPITINDASASWKHTFPGNSISVIRFKTR